MRRIVFLGSLVLSIFAAPAAYTEELRTPRIGFLLMGSSQAGLTSAFDAFREGLRELGWIEDENVVIEYRWAGESPDRLPELSAELVRLKVDVIIGSTPGARAAQQATTSIPITQTAAHSLGVMLQSVEVRTADDFESAFAAVLKGRAQALVVGPGQFMFTHQRQVVEFATKNHLPSIYAWKGPASAGGLLAYGVNIPQVYHRAAYYVDKILKGTKPGDLPIEQPTKFDFVVNLKTAKSLGITIPQSILLQADEVIR